MITGEKLIKAILAVDERIISGRSLKEVLNFLLRKSCSLLGADSATIRLKSNDGKNLELLASYRTSRSESQKMLPLDGDSPAALAFLRAEAQIVQDISKSEIYPWKEVVEERGLVTVPLVMNGEAKGVLSVYSEAPRSFTPEEVEILCLFANKAIMTIELLRSIEMVKEASIVDVLTGLYNHRFFHERLEEEAERSNRTSVPFSVAMMDLDDFKRINDKYGHLCGDQALARIAEVIRRNKRRTDLAFRYGGEEFALILPGTTSLTGAKVLKRIKDAVSVLKFDGAADSGCPEAIGVTLSAGIASYPKDARNKSAIIDKADKALLRAKRSGKNCIAVFDPPELVA